MGVDTFPKGICMKVNVTAQIAFRLTYFEAVIQYVSHYTMATPHQDICLFLAFKIICKGQDALRVHKRKFLQVAI